MIESNVPVGASFGDNTPTSQGLADDHAKHRSLATGTSNLSAIIKAQGLKGERTKHRLLAAGTDNLGAIIFAFVIAKQFTFTSELVQGLSAYVLYLVYFFISEAIFSTTPAKAFFGLTVVSLTGKRCTVWQAAIRTFLRIVEVNPLLLGGLPAILCAYCSGRGQRIGDMFASTVVVRDV